MAEIDLQNYQLVLDETGKVIHEGGIVSLKCIEGKRFYFKPILLYMQFLLIGNFNIRC